MLIKKIKLKNIRSYKEEEITFPEGSILLSGNIGSGKSTILLAIDFALFGISRDLPGTALLRNGENEGFVELHIRINEKDIKIRRVLKRSQSTVSQDTGRLDIDGDIKDLTAMELKQRILEILNYPSELLTKSKSMIYHYTVYSPQEKMKEILLSKKEDRLEILRRVFGIDKYQRVRNNTEIFIDVLKQKSKEIAAMVADLEQKLEELAEQKQRELEIKSFLEELLPDFVKTKELVDNKKKTFEALEAEFKESQKIKHEIEKVQLSIGHKSSEINELKEKKEYLHAQITNITEELAKLPISDPSLAERIKILENECSMLDEQNIHSHKKMGEIESQKAGHERLCDNINNLEKCPTCHQNIDSDHKKEVSKKASSEIEKLDREIIALKVNLEQNTSRVNHKKNEIKKLESSLSNQRIIEIRQNELNIKKKELQIADEKLDLSKHNLAELNSNVIFLKSKLSFNPQLEENIKTQKNEFEALSQNLKDLEIKKASLESELKIIMSVIKRIANEVEIKIKLRDNIGKLMQIREWLEKQFINITIVMEKNIMLRVHAELESLIQKWFANLVDSETIKIRIDEEFTPIIEQNGYEIEYIHLSGGEKTAAALSYRLALNQVINTLMSAINTKDILMLDEPTDGFSQEQLERMHNILEELNTKQTIIVSHDPKVESFVDTVIRLDKKEHSTRINT